MAAPYYGGAGAPAATDQCLSQVELRVECRNLLNKDVMSKSDPCAVMFMSRRGGHMDEVGRTENVKNSLDPKFAKHFTVKYYFEEVQKVRIAVYDLDNSTPSLGDDDFLGQVDCTLGELVSNSPYTKPLMLRDGKRAGNSSITIRAQEVKEGGEMAQIFFKAKKLENKDFLGKSDPYLELQRPTPDGSWQIIHRTEVVKNDLNPSWRPVSLSVQSLCGGNRQQSIKLDVYDWDSDGSHDFIGGCSTTLEEMVKASGQEITLTLINPAKQAKKKSYKNSGMLIISSCKVTKEYTFLEYIFGGMQVNFTVGIDFTGSNGNPKQPTSLHYIDPYRPNEYMQAIRAVGDVCQDYDTDKMFPALGFGARIPPNMEVSHEFAINFQPQNPFCAGIDGVLQAYANCIRCVQLYGPTNVAPIIHHVARFAADAQREEGSKGAHAYFILLLLTDGVLSDMGDTKSAIVQASALPMSLIIVGVGNADFDAMNELDGDNGVLRAPSGQPVKRDIVQFVPFREFKQSTAAELARHVLAEVPRQVVEYYKMRGMKPNPKRETPTQPIGAPGAQPPPQGAPPTQPGGPPQWQGQGAPAGQPGGQWQGQPGAQPQWQGAPPGQPQWQGAPPGQPGAQQQWQGAPTGQPQWQGAPPGQPGAQQQWQGAPPGQPGAQQQWQGAPPGQPGAQQQWQGAPTGQPQWQGAPQGAPTGQPGAQPQWQGAPPTQPGGPPTQPGAPPQGQGAPPTQPGAQP
ncbi:hypothetical protein BaRGS_00004119 [Batillaria attramentaria]|uniref:Copine-3 n=1 Tax=Batillaria attramentaria TaxID=370345 RepID=A0ABD0M015_9CAEN